MIHFFHYQYRALIRVRIHEFHEWIWDINFSLNIIHWFERGHFSICCREGAMTSMENVWKHTERREVVKARERDIGRDGMINLQGVPHSLHKLRHVFLHPTSRRCSEYWSAFNTRRGNFADANNKCRNLNWRKILTEQPVLAIDGRLSGVHSYWFVAVAKETGISCSRNALDESESTAVHLEKDFNVCL